MSEPSQLPVPVDDGAADHLPGLAVPRVVLPCTSGESIALDDLGPGRTVLYVYPLTARPDRDLPDGWDIIPGARGCWQRCCTKPPTRSSTSAGSTTPAGRGDILGQVEVVELAHE